MKCENVEWMIKILIIDGKGCVVSPMNMNRQKDNRWRWKIKEVECNFTIYSELDE